MDLVAACRAFVAVSAHGSFTTGAAIIGVPQSVASRRIASLEQHLGERLLDRSTRRATLTLFGLDLLPAARRLVAAAEAMDRQATRSRLGALTLAVPDVCPPRALVRLVAEARQHDLHLEVRPAGPAERAELVRDGEVRAAVVAVPPDEGAWRVPLGLATAPGAGPGSPGAPIFLDALRPGRLDSTPHRRIWLQPEDDVPHVRDRLTRAGAGAGLEPAQTAPAVSLVDAAARVLASQHLLLCSRSQADQLGLAWAQTGDVRLERGYQVLAGQRQDADRLRALLALSIGHCVGAPPPTSRLPPVRPAHQPAPPPPVRLGGEE